MDSKVPNKEEVNSLAEITRARILSRTQVEKWLIFGSGVALGVIIGTAVVAVVYGSTSKVE